MILPVEWTCKDNLETQAEAIAVYGDEPIPVIRVDALRRWIDQQNRYTTGLDDLLAQLPEEGAGRNR